MFHISVSVHYDFEGGGGERNCLAELLQEIRDKSDQIKLVRPSVDCKEKLWLCTHA